MGEGRSIGQRPPYWCEEDATKILTKDQQMISIPISVPVIGEEEKAAVLGVLESGMLAMGPVTARFEQEFARTCGVQHAVAVSSGTTALHLALLANDIGPGDEVITTAFTFISTVNAILFAGAKPVFVDIEDKTFNIDLNQVGAAISPHTKAILPVHLYGHLCDVAALQDIAEKNGLRIIEDACQSVTATYNGRAAGSFGTGAFSFYATKNMMTGEGGMITTDDARIAQRCRMLRNHGMQQRYHYEMLGYNYRMMDLQAAIGLEQLKRLPSLVEKRRKNAAFLGDGLESVITPQEMEGYRHVWHQYTVRLPVGTDRDAAAARLNRAGIGTGIYYPVPNHMHDHVREAAGDVHLPVTERMADEVISLPVHPMLSHEDLERIVAEVNRI
jgi:perosamine synthetase